MLVRLSFIHSTPSHTLDAEYYDRSFFSQLGRTCSVVSGPQQSAGSVLQCVGMHFCSMYAQGASCPNTKICPQIVRCCRERSVGKQLYTFCRMLKYVPFVVKNGKHCDFTVITRNFTVIRSNFTVIRRNFTVNGFYKCPKLKLTSPVNERQADHSVGPYLQT